MGIFKDVLENSSKKEAEKKEINENLSGISFLDKNLKKVVVSITEDKLLKFSVFNRSSTSYDVSEIILDQDHINFLAAAMLEFTKYGTLDKLKKKLGQDNE